MPKYSGFRGFLQVVAPLAMVIAAAVCGSGPATHENASRQQNALLATACDDEEFEAILARIANGGRALYADALDRMVADTNIIVNELHDCQRLLASDDSYGPLVGIFVPADLDTLYRSAARPEGVVLADIINYGPGTNHDLGISSLGLHCLLVHGTNANNPNTWKAAVVPAPAGKSCKVPGSLHPTSWLKVKPLKIESGQAIYPSVARWDRDSHGPQFIGIRCGDNWCEIGPANMLGHARIKTWRDVPGRYDEQPLGVTVLGKLRPSGLIAKVIPEDVLASTDPAAFRRPTLVAKVALSGFSLIARPKYAMKFNFGLTRDSTYVYMVYSPAGKGTWYAQGRAPGDPVPPPLPDASWKKLDAMVYPHSGHGTVRWRWDPTDEKVWFSCAAGCCSAKGL